MSLLHDLYRGETRLGFIRTRKWWYLASVIMVTICIVSFIVRGFNFGIDFVGGTQFQITPSTGITTEQVDSAIAKEGIVDAEAAQQVGADTITIKIGSITPELVQKAQADLAKNLGIDASHINLDSVGSSWGHDVTVTAIEGLIIFLIAVAIYISIRYQWRMAVGAIAALLHDLIITAGVYSLVGFEVTPSTIVGLLTILGFSLYDTVVVYDKVAENSKNILASNKRTYSEAANLAVNQTLMRSINTSLISLLPVAGLLVIGVGFLGVGTIEDLALVLFVGLAVGAYSSLFLATPILVDLTERQPQYKALTRRVVAKRSSDAKRKAAATAAVPVGAPDASEQSAAAGATGSGGTAVRRSLSTAPAPRPGARPQRPGSQRPGRRKR